MPADVLLGKFKKDVSFALRRGTIAQVTTHVALDGYAWPTRRRGKPIRQMSPPGTRKRLLAPGTGSAATKAQLGRLIGARWQLEAKAALPRAAPARAPFRNGGRRCTGRPRVRCCADAAARTLLRGRCCADAAARAEGSRKQKEELGDEQGGQGLARPGRQDRVSRQARPCTAE